MDIVNLPAKEKQPYTIKKESFVIEGFEEPVYNVYKEGKKILSLEADEQTGKKIIGMTVYSPLFKTPEGICTGSIFKVLKSRYTIAGVNTEGERGPEVRIIQNKLIFVLDGRKIPLSWWHSGDADLIPDSVPVSEIILD